MRKFFKHAAFSVAFIAILIVILAVGSKIFMPKNNGGKDGMYDPSAKGILAEPENSIDVVFIGDSEVYSSIVPLTLWSEYGITSYACSTPVQKLWYSYEFLQDAFVNQKPKIVVLEASVLYREFSAGDTINNKIDEIFPIFYFHDRWKSLKKSDLKFDVSYTHIENTKGYRYSTAVAPIDGSYGYDDTNYMKQSIYCKGMTSRNLSYFNKIKALCDENGAELLLLSVPSVKNWDYTRHNGAEKLALQRKIDFIDMNLMQDELSIDWHKDTRDKGEHLNYFGAQKVTKYLGEYFTEGGKLEDHRKDEAYKQWNKELDNFNKNKNKKPEYDKHEAIK